ncbi:hypothetical protein [Methylomonas sp. MK1]|uniref:hypothetical protein n=1 Tax=Methylomonas sp. MK1 TaxID=1131552 RepID=UPI00036E6D14|nr:hypothetical protein [Methylomonas sp. MK1]
MNQTTRYFNISTALALVWLAWAVLGVVDVAAKEKSASSGKRATRNLPDIDTTEPAAIDVEQETNIFSNAAVANLSANFGLAAGWDVGLSVLNAQFASTTSPAAPFQPDILFNVEKHWTTENLQVIVGTQSGIGIVEPNNVFMSLSYLEYQRHLPDWDVDIDTGVYYANAGIANHDSVGMHFSAEIPLWDGLRLNGDYWSGNNAVGSKTVKLIYPLVGNWRLGLGAQFPNLNNGDQIIGIVGLYWQTI